MKVYLKNKCDRTSFKIEPPKQATEHSAGYDVTALSEPIIVGDIVNFPLDNFTLYRRIDYIQYHTGIYISPESPNEHIEILPRSSVSNKNLILANGIGLIDADFTQEILLRFHYIPAAEDLFVLPEAGITRIYYKINYEKIYSKNDRIGQLVARTTIPIKFELVDFLSQTARVGGFGSSGK